MLSRRITIVLAIVLLIGAAMASRFILGQKKPAERIVLPPSLKQVRVLRVSNGDLPTEVEISGRLLAAQKIELYAEVGGLLTPESRKFREGNAFQKGEKLIVIDSEEPRLALQAQRSSLMNQITLLLPDLKTDYPESFAAWDSYLRQMDPSQDLAALPAPASDREKYYLSARNIYNLFYSIRSQEARLAKYTLRAPFGGTVSEALIKEGTLVRVGQKLGEFSSTQAYELEAAVNLADLEYVKEGNSVQLSSDEGAARWTGRILRISDKVDAATQTLRIFVSVSGQGLKEGMYLSGFVRGRVASGVFAVPRSALTDGKQLYRVGSDSLLSRVQVEPVYMASSTALVRGLPEGSLIVAESPAGIYEGLKIAPYEGNGQ